MSKNKYLTTETCKVGDFIQTHIFDKKVCLINPNLHKDSAFARVFDFEIQRVMLFSKKARITHHFCPTPTEISQVAALVAWYS